MKGGFLSLPFCSNNCMCDKEGSTSRGEGRKMGKEERSGGEREGNKEEVKGTGKEWGRGGEKEGMTEGE